MPSLGGCHELRVNDRNRTWRLFYFLDDDAIVILEVDEKKTQKTAKATKEVCQRRLKNYEEAKYKKQKTKEVG